MVKIQWTILGVAEICCLYFLPVVNVEKIGSNYTTVQQMVGLCSNPVLSIFGAGSNTCQMYTGFFYIGWLTGLIFIGYGFFAKNEISSSESNDVIIIPFLSGKFKTNEPRELLNQISQIIETKGYPITQEQFNIIQDPVGSGGIVNIRYSFEKTRVIKKVDNSSNTLWAIALCLISFVFLGIFLPVSLLLVIISGYLIFFRKSTTTRQISIKNEIIISGNGTFFKNANDSQNTETNTDIALSISNRISPNYENDQTIMSDFKVDCDSIRSEVENM